MSLREEPGQDVKNFGNKMAKMSRRISGTWSATIYLYTLVATDFIGCEVLAFQMKATRLHDLFNSNLKSVSADDIIRTPHKNYSP